MIFMDEQTLEEIEKKSSTTVQKMEKIASSAQYREAIEKIKGWLMILENEPRRAEEVNQERIAYMINLEKTYPQIYGAVKVNDKRISEKLYLIKTGESIVID
jgi:hypothetical protein